MRTAPVVFLLALVTPAAAQQHKPPAKPAEKAPAAAAGPKKIGQFEDWIAATHLESGQTVCYAFVLAKASAPVLPNRGQVVLTVTERPSGRDAVAIAAGYSYPKGAAVTMQVLTTGLDFYTSGSDAFARDGKATVGAFQKGEQAMSRGPGPKGETVADTFSLKGFSAAYAAINKACPAR